MNTILLFCLIVFAASSSSKNLILIGDSRYVQMSIYYIGLPWDGRNVRTTSPKSFQGYSIQSTAQGSASYKNFNEGGELYNSVINQLSKAAANTNVLLWLGVNSLWDSNGTFNFYAKLAKKYPKLSFHAISVTGVDESKWKNVNNNQVTNFNNNLRKLVNGSGSVSNLRYLDILYANDPTRIVSSGKTIGINKYSPDGLHYDNTGYRFLFNAMVEKL
jgi:lysophospholipase L1-like esterase